MSTPAIEKDVDGNPLKEGDYVMRFWEPLFDYPLYYKITFGKLLVDIELLGEGVWQFGYALQHIKSGEYHSLPYNKEGVLQVKKVDKLPTNL